MKIKKVEKDEENTEYNLEFNHCMELNDVCSVVVKYFRKTINFVRPKCV